MPFSRNGIRCAQTKVCGQHFVGLALYGSANSISEEANGSKSCDGKCNRRQQNDYFA
jgi:hypothetical protein